MTLICNASDDETRKEAHQSFFDVAATPRKACLLALFLDLWMGAYVVAVFDGGGGEQAAPESPAAGARFAW
jgi:hypothetical protein